MTNEALALDPRAYHYTAATQKAAERIHAGTVSKRAHLIGLTRAEPLIVMMDALLSYAEAYQVRFERPLAEDYVLGPYWLESAKGVRGLLNGDGAIAMRDGITTDSKDNGAVEQVFWAAMAAAGFTESDL